MPSEPRGAPTLQMKGDNQSLILVNWLEPEKPSGLVDHYVIHINTTNAEEELTVKGKPFFSTIFTNPPEII